MKSVLPAGVHHLLGRAAYSVQAILEKAAVFGADFRASLRSVGLIGLPALFIAFVRASGRRGRLTKVRMRSARPIWLRSGSSDFEVFLQVILRQEYAAVTLSEATRVVDAGGNIGLTSFYFLERYPDSTVIMVEPDAGNFDIAKRNLSVFGSRCILLNAALWSSCGRLALKRGQFRDGRDWATQVGPVSDSAEDSVASVTVDDVLKDQRWDSIDLLKIDVEGAEAEIFAAGAEFLSKVSCCAIELHGRECEGALAQAIEPFKTNIMCSGELTVVTFDHALAHGPAPTPTCSSCSDADAPVTTARQRSGFWGHFRPARSRSE